MAIKASLVKGTRDLLPLEMRKREYILQILRRHFRRYGFQAIETPALEKLETLTGKYGQEGDRLIFKILPRGRKLEEALAQAEPEKSLNETLEEALRYDLTVPFARLVSQHRHALDFPFKRYQIQPVWRADRPQKGRFREFYQCDADVVGARSLLQELDFIALYDGVFQELKLPVEIRLNHRQVLAGISENFGLAAHFGAFTIALDKLDKIGLDGVRAELQKQALPEGALEALAAIQNWQEHGGQNLEALETLVGSSEAGQQGLSELRFLVAQSEALGIGGQLLLDLRLARGLDYYTGAIFEVSAADLSLGSLGGGGRYDELTDVFGVKDLPGVGISFGLERIELALEEKGLLGDIEASVSQILICNFGQNEALHGMKIAQKLRSIGLNVELYPETAKLKKQLDYARKKDIHYALLIGEEEIAEGRYGLKDMREGEQQVLSEIEILEFFHAHQKPLHGLH